MADGTPTPDPVAAALDGIRERMNQRLTMPPTSATAMMGSIKSAADVPRLLAALDAVLDVAAQCDREAAEHQAILGRPGGAVHFPAVSAAGKYAQAIRDAITAGLLGEGSGR